jgi:hypothetical protein
VEETVHYAMAQRPEARQVLLVSGGISGTAREILKYGCAQVDYVELDPLILALGKRYLPENLEDRESGHQHRWPPVREADPGDNTMWSSLMFPPRLPRSLTGSTRRSFWRGQARAGQRRGGVLRAWVSMRIM